MSWTSLLMIGQEHLRSGSTHSAISTFRLVLRLAHPNLSGAASAALATALLLAGKPSGHHLTEAAGLPSVGSSTVVWMNLASVDAHRYGEDCLSAWAACKHGARERAGDAAALLEEVCILSSPTSHNSFCDPASFLRSWPRTLLDVARAERLPHSSTANSQLQLLQGLGGCLPGRRMLIYSLTGTADGVGLGCELHLLAIALSRAYTENRTLVLDPDARWSVCPTGV